MKLVAQPAWVGARGVDCVTPISEPFAAWLVSNEFDYVSRYLGSLSKTEIAIIVGHGLAFFPVCYAGQRDPAPHVAALHALGVPATVTTWSDTESVPTHGDPEAAASKLRREHDAWAVGIHGGGWDPGGYFANDTLLTAVELGQLIIDRYWQGASMIVDRHGQQINAPVTATGPIGWCGKQVCPGNLTSFRGKPTPGGIQIDIDFVYEDFRGRVPTWCVGVP